MIAMHDPDGISEYKLKISYSHAEQQDIAPPLRSCQYQDFSD